jgi:hypothetical protein
MAALVAAISFSVASESTVREQQVLEFCREHQQHKKPPSSMIPDGGKVMT